MRLAKVQSLRAVFGLLTLAIVSSAVHSQALGATESIRWNFGNGMDGAAPEAGPIMDKAGQSLRHDRDRRGRRWTFGRWDSV